ncbi:MAG: DUF559 domain-containing protein [Solirubrobacteraceae bacterium]
MNGEPLAYRAQDEHRTSKVRVGTLAARQCGLVTWAQLRTIGIAPGTVRRWVATGYLIPTLPRVYAVGHRTEDERARLFSLILFAGPNAALSHGTSAHWRGWLRHRVPATHITTPRRIRTAFADVVFHGPREADRERVNDVPCTTVTQTLLDLAATERPKLTLRALAQLDYERRLDAGAIRTACGRGRPGSAALLRAAEVYIPQLARTRSDLEDDFLLLCRRFGIPLPKVNTLVHGFEVDCHWPQFGLVVELDGRGNHGTSAQRNRDHRRDMVLRAHGLPVIRYTEDQVTHQARAVAADVRAEQHRRGA